MVPIFPRTCFSKLLRLFSISSYRSFLVVCWVKLRKYYSLVAISHDSMIIFKRYSIISVTTTYPSFFICVYLLLFSTHVSLKISETPFLITILLSISSRSWLWWNCEISILSCFSLWESMDISKLHSFPHLLFFVIPLSPDISLNTFALSSSQSLSMTLFVIDCLQPHARVVLGDYG